MSRRDAHTDSRLQVAVALGDTLIMEDCPLVCEAIP